MSTEGREGMSANEWGFEKDIGTSEGSVVEARGRVRLSRQRGMRLFYHCPRRSCCTSYLEIRSASAIVPSDTPCLFN